MISHGFSHLPTMVLRIRAAIATRCQIYLFLLLALVSGAVLPIQASLNAQLARSLSSVPLAASISYGVGGLALLTILLTRRSSRPDWSALGKTSWWSYTGGVLGVGYIVSSIYFTGILGPTLTLGFAICGQAFAGIITDHFGWLGVPQYRLTPHRRFAIGLLLAAIFFLVQS